MDARKWKWLLAAATLFVLLPAGWAVWKHERTLDNGQVVLLELAPVDPRSLMQGDYMALDFAVDRELREHLVPDYAYIVIDEHGRATLAGVGDSLPAPEGQIAMRLRRRNGNLGIGPNAFFFQEGMGREFADARWGEFHVAANGNALLTHLRNEQLERLPSSGE